MAAPHETLGIDLNASQKAAKAAWKKLLREHHPDVHAPELRPRKNALIKRVNAAYDEFCDPNYVRKQTLRQRRSQRQAKPRENASEEYKKSFTRYVIEISERSAEHILTFIQESEEYPSVETCRHIQRDFWKGTLWNFLRFRFKREKELPWLHVIPRKFIYYHDTKEVILISSCRWDTIPTFFILPSLNFKDATDTQRTVPFDIFL